MPSKRLKMHPESVEERIFALIAFVFAYQDVLQQR
jgi:hypothetical protein